MKSNAAGLAENSRQPPYAHLRGNAQVMRKGIGSKKTP